MMLQGDEESVPLVWSDTSVPTTPALLDEVHDVGDQDEVVLVSPTSSEHTDHSVVDGETTADQSPSNEVSVTVDVASLEKDASPSVDAIDPSVSPQSVPIADAIVIGGAAVDVSPVVENVVVLSAPLDDVDDTSPLLGATADVAAIVPPPAIPVQVAANGDRLHFSQSQTDIRISKFSAMPSMQKSQTFRLAPRPKSADKSHRGELQRFLSTPFHDDGDYGSTATSPSIGGGSSAQPLLGEDKSRTSTNLPPKQPSARRSVKAGRRDRGMDDTKWDFVLVFPNPEFEKDKKDKQVKYPFIPTMNDMLTKLRQAGLDTQLSKSTNLDVDVPKDQFIPPFVYCKLSASTERLKEEAARVHMSIGLVENKLERMAKQGEVRFHIENPEDRAAEIKRQGHEPLPPEKVSKVARRPYKKIQFQAGRELDVFNTFDMCELENMDLEASDVQSPTTTSSSSSRSSTTSSSKTTQEAPPSLLSAIFAMFKRFRYKPYQYIHMTYTPQENVQNLYGTPLFCSIKRIRLIESIVRSATGAGLDLDMLVQFRAISSFYPLHDDEYCRDIQSTWSTSLWLTHQPIEATRDYFGGQAALYLAYVAHITRWLLFPSIFSISLYFMSERYLVWVFGFVMVLWATLFLKMWKRKLAVLGMKWGLTDFHAQDHDRPEFDESINRHMPSAHFGSMIFFRRVFCFVVTVVCLLLVLATKASLFYVRWISKATPERFDFAMPLLFDNQTISLSYGGQLKIVAVVNVLAICVWSNLFARVNSFLTDIEVHHTETSAQQSFIFKGVVFELVNNFAGIMYIAFVKPHLEGIDGDFAGPDVEAVEELSEYMLYIYGCQLLFHILVHVIFPWIRSLCCMPRGPNVPRRNKKTNRPRLQTSLSLDDKSVSRDIEAAAVLPPLVQPKLLPVEVQHQLKEYGWKGLFQDYIVMVMQFGYATLFVVSCPYLPLLAFLYNLVSIRAHSLSLVTVYRRLAPRSSQHIRLWAAFLEVFCVLAVVTNSWSVVAKAEMAARTLAYLHLDNDYYVLVRSLCIGGLVLGLYSMGKVLGFFINDIPTRVQIQLERQEYYISKVLHLGYQWDKTMHSILFAKSQEELEADEGYGWDYAIVFPNPEVRRPPNLHPLTGKVEQVASMRDMILKLHKAGLQVQFFESTAKVSSFIPSMVLCKVRASEQRLEAEAHRVKMPLRLNPDEMAFQATQGAVTTVWQRVRKHVLAIEAELAVHRLDTLLVEIKALTEKADSDDVVDASAACVVTWDQLLTQLYLVLDDFIKQDVEIKAKYKALGVDPQRHSSMIKLTTLSTDMIEKLIIHHDEDESLVELLLNAPRLLDDISAGLQQAGKDIGVQISLLPILLPSLAKRRKANSPMLPEHDLQKLMEALSQGYAKMIPLLIKMGHVLALTLPLPDLKAIEALLEKRDVAGLRDLGEPNEWLRTELHLMHLMIQDVSLELPQLRQRTLILDTPPLSVAATVQVFLEAVIANPMIDISPFYLQNPDPMYKGLTAKFRYAPYEHIYMAYQDKKELQHWYNKTASLHGPMQLFNSTERLSLIESIITNNEVGAGLHLDKLILSGAIKGYFPLHDDHMKADLWKKWKWSLHQPIEEIRAYFGVKIGLYFAYLGHYTSWLMLSAVVGLGVFATQMLQKRYFPPEIAEGFNWVKVLAVPIYGVFMVVWATLFLKHWIRKQWVFSMRWGMTDFHEEEQVRPQFQGMLMRDPVTGARMRYFSDKQRRWRLMFSWFVLAILICVVLVFVAGIFVLRYEFKHSVFIEVPYFGNIGTQLASLANVAQIFMMSQVYNYMCNSLNDFENHRTDSDYENHFVAKAIVFQFVNNFALLFYVAFLKKILEHECVDNNCMTELEVSLTYVYASQLVIGNCQEVIMPLFWANVEYFRHEWVKKSDDHEVVSAVETQFFMPEYGWAGTFWDYLEMIIQFGYSTFFVLACPLAPVFSFCNNIFEIRIDGSKISKFCRRPRPSGASTIGHWVKVLDVFGIITIVTNSWIIVTTSKFGDLILLMWPKFDQYFSTMGLFFTLTAVLLAVKGLINSFIPDMPRHVRAQLKRQRFVVSKILSTHDTD
ncbi:hypothetical protein DYB37_004181 [Aphanomyces astaci]|uniref:Anoctamin transmembrane domain-containing protein n=1 Tax=Aphanomyces astaci TaxID=112090 RepID=A0A418EPP9_APHAT|nr:hypothetical protein DYB37_004181 [Aphanomyces astaci]